ncbi:MAG TPA: helix-turn-helix transcriptional regulator [Longimicrobiales bacterium]
MIFDPNPGREIRTTTTTTLDDHDVWREITRVARAALREGDEGDVAGSLASRLRAALPDGETWDIRTQPLLHATDDRPVVVVAIERVVPASAMAPAPEAAPAAPRREPAHPAPTRHLTAGADPQVEEIRSRFGLSQRQAEVAALLARRLTDKEIASRLGVSRHTARRHVELTMIRLRVHSRSEVGELLAGAA